MKYLLGSRWGRCLPTCQCLFLLAALPGARDLQDKSMSSICFVGFLGHLEAWPAVTKPTVTNLDNCEALLKALTRPPEEKTRPGHQAVLGRSHRDLKNYNLRRGSGNGSGHGKVSSQLVR